MGIWIEFIVLIMIIQIVRSIVKANYKGGGEREGFGTGQARGPEALPYRPSGAVGQSSGAVDRPSGAVGQPSGTAARPSGAAGQSSGTAARPSGAAGQSSGSAARSPRSAPQDSGAQEEMSTIAYLNRKAEEDAREHAVQKQEERRQARKDLAGRREGVRLLPGDPVPQGMRVAVCPYCGAENLVPGGSRDKFGCYFCREDLR